MAKGNQQQWAIRYRGHKHLKNASMGWIEMITWDKQAANRSRAELAQYWNEVEVVPYIDPVRRRQYANEYRRRDRDDDSDR